jgi:hypothetical protein
MTYGKMYGTTAAEMQVDTWPVYEYFTPLDNKNAPLCSQNNEVIISLLQLPAIPKIAHDIPKNVVLGEG